MKHFLILAAIMLAAFGAAAQEMTVASFSQNTMDLSAATSPRPDLNGVPCALVKVLMPEGAEFEGNIIRPVEFRTGEYWVYVTAGTKQIRVKHASAKPVQVVFAGYGIPSLESKMTYVLDMDMPAARGRHSASSAHNYLVLTVSPADAKVTFDGQLQELQNGTLRMLVRKNSTHDYLVEAPGYFPEQGTVSIGAEKVERSIALRSRKGTLAVNTTTAGTEIYINGEKTATGSWRGEVVPGDYLVEGRREGHVSEELLVAVATGEQTSVTIPALEAITGSLNVDYRPDGASISIDGTASGTTPNVLDGLLVGAHRVAISAPGYATATRDVTIRDSEVTTLSGTLERQAAPKAADAVAPAQSVGGFSTTPVHLALCATDATGRAVYITASQWQALTASQKSSFKPRGVYLAAGNFLVELHDKEGGKYMDWDYALKYNLPTKAQSEVLVNNKEALNSALKAFGGTVMDKLYWTKTEYNSSYAWTVHMGSGNVYTYNKSNTYRVRAVAPVPVASAM